MKKILVIIPAFNAEKTISRLIGLISVNNIEKENILVVDDGSIDSTYEIARSCGVKVLQHKKNKGKGEALKTGFEYAIRKNYTGVITLDADLQHDPKFIPEFIKALVGVRQRRTSPAEQSETSSEEQRRAGCPTYESFSFPSLDGRGKGRVTPLPNPLPQRGEGTPIEIRQRRTSPAKQVLQRSRPDILVGTRERNLKMMPFSRWLTNNLTSMIVSIMGFTNVRDSQSGYRYISAEVLKSIRLKTKKYELESELLIKAGRKGFKISPVYISTIYQGSKSFINPFVDTGRFIKLMWKALFW
jgi:glycosyltransferase involved in cell wall biosynthesis